MSDQPTVIVSATNLLSQWKELLADRQKQIEERKNNWMLPPIGIEEAIRNANGDLSDVMWFLDKTLKLLASQEAQQHPAPPSAEKAKG
jgi:hypothetical protein